METTNKKTLGDIGVGSQGKLVYLNLAQGSFLSKSLKFIKTSQQLSPAIRLAKINKQAVFFLPRVLQVGLDNESDSTRKSCATRVHKLCGIPSQRTLSRQQNHETVFRWGETLFENDIAVSCFHFCVEKNNFGRMLCIQFALSKFHLSNFIDGWGHLVVVE